MPNFQYICLQLYYTACIFIDFEDIVRHIHISRFVHLHKYTRTSRLASPTQPYTSRLASPTQPYTFKQMPPGSLRLHIYNFRTHYSSAIWLYGNSRIANCSYCEIYESGAPFSGLSRFEAKQKNISDASFDCYARWFSVTYLYIFDYLPDQQNCNPIYLLSFFYIIHLLRRPQCQCYLSSLGGLF